MWEPKVSGHRTRKPRVEVAVPFLAAPIRNGLEVDFPPDQAREDSAAVEAAAQGQNEVGAVELKATVHGLLERFLNFAHRSVVNGERSK
jgi:hypothetical protein